MLKFEVRELEPYRIMGLTGRIRDIADLWKRLGEGFHDGRLSSVQPAVEAIGAVLPHGNGPQYVAGVPCDSGATADGFEVFEVPGGRYAVFNHRGPHEEMPQMMRALEESVRASGEVRAGGQIEIYYADEGGTPNVDIGVRLESP